MHDRIYECNNFEMNFGGVKWFGGSNEVEIEKMK